MLVRAGLAGVAAGVLSERLGLCPPIYPSI